MHWGKMPNSTQCPSRLATVLTFPHTYSAPDTLAFLLLLIHLRHTPHSRHSHGLVPLSRTLSLDIGMSNSLTTFQFLFRYHLFKETYSEHSLKLHHNLPHLQFLYFPFPFPDLYFSDSIYHILKHLTIYLFILSISFNQNSM